MSTTTGFCGGIRKIVYTLVKKVPYENKLWVLIRSAVPRCRASARHNICFHIWVKQMTF